MIKLNSIFTNYLDFKNKVIDNLKSIWGDVEWLNETNSYMKFNTIYQMVDMYYGDRTIRYDNESIFLKKFNFDISDLLPDIYSKQQVFIKNELSKFLSDNTKRAIVIENTSTNQRDSDSNSKIGNSTTPTNKVITNASELADLPITSSNLSNVKLLENYNGTNQQVNNNYINDLTKALNTDYSLRLKEFMELMRKHFVFIVGNYNVNDDGDGDEDAKFNNGYFVKDVPYLCEDNKGHIDSINKNLTDYNIRVDKVESQIADKQNTLTAGTNISIVGDVISASGGLSPEQEEQIKTNTKNINDVSLKVISLENRSIGWDNIKGLDNLVEGDNIVLQPQGSNEVFINTSKSLNVDTIRSDSGVVTMLSETHFENILHIKNGLIIENGNINSEIDMLDNDLKIINTNGDILVTDKIGNYALRELKVGVDNNKNKLKLLQQELKSYATNESVDSKDSLILQEAKDYGDSLKPQIMDLNGSDFIWSDSYSLYYKEVKPSQIPFNKVISYSIWSTNNIGKDDFNGLALTSFVRQISSGGFNVYIMNNSKKIPAINEFKVRISYFK